MSLILSYNITSSFFLRRQLLYDFWSKKKKENKEKERERENRSTILATTC